MFSKYNDKYLIYQKSTYIEKYELYVTIGYLWWKRRKFIAEVDSYDKARIIFSHREIDFNDERF